MRLLHSTTFQFKEFTNENVPEYAILSHTWKDGEEITFQDMTEFLKTNPIADAKERLSAFEKKFQDTVASREAGCKKIMFTAAEAKKAGLDYFWVDTCCIDKSSSSELSEAINSMYHWYSKARTCYVYLADVDVSSRFGSKWKGQFSQSRWLTRGWTLQELIAPPNLIFYNKDGHFIDDRNNFIHDISELTGIPQSVLRGNDTNAVSVAKRMQWAANRKTSRGEDMAYCLMGIFHINMPMLYGEGTQRAFLRLQEEILKTSDDRSIFSWTDPTARSSTFTGLLANSPAHFYDRRRMPTIPDAKPYRLTNKGLKIHLHLVPRPKSAEEFYGVLERNSTSPCKTWGVFLKKIDHDMYSRVDANRLWNYFEEDIDVPDETSVVYIAQEPLLMPRCLDLSRIYGIRLNKPMRWKHPFALGRHIEGDFLVLDKLNQLQLELSFTDTIFIGCDLFVTLDIGQLWETKYCSLPTFLFPDPKKECHQVDAALMFVKNDLCIDLIW